jgi:hypothetical protein
MILLICASQIAGIIGMSHHTLPRTGALLDTKWMVCESTGTAGEGGVQRFLRF